MLCVVRPKGFVTFTSTIEVDRSTSLNSNEYNHAVSDYVL